MRAALEKMLLSRVSVSIRFLLPLCISLSLFPLQGIAQAIIHVPSDAPTVQAGIDAASNGDTVLVASGTYNENIDFKGKAITVTSGASDVSAATMVILNGSDDGPVVTLSTNEPASAVLNGFTIQGGHASLASQKNGGGIYISGAAPQITNNLVRANLGCGIAAFNGASPIIRGNISRENSADSTGGSQCAGPQSQVGQPGIGIALIQPGDVVVDSNLVESNTCIASSRVTCGTTGIYVLAGGVISIKNNTIRNNFSNDTAGLLANTSSSTQLRLIQNLIYNNNGNSGAYFEQVKLYGAQRAPFPSLLEINNTIYGGGETIVFSFNPSSKLENNIFINNTNIPAAGGGSSGLSCGDPEAIQSGIQINNNDIYNPRTSVSGQCILGTGNQSVDPQFVNASSGDFHLQAASSLLASGDIQAPMIPPTDLDAKARTVCNTIDMGVYERRPHPPIALSSSSNPTHGGNPVTLTARLTGNCNLPTGTVTLFDGATQIGTATLNNSAIATLTTSFLVVGQHNITVQYPGDFNFDESTSDVLVLTITGDPTTTSLSVLPNPASAFSPITFQAAVTSPFGVPTGSVVFSAGGKTLATAALDASGKAASTISTLGVGTYPVVATYSADTRFQASTSPAIQEVVLAAGTSTFLTASPNPAAVTQPITFTVLVRPVQGNSIPSGNVTLLDGGTVLGTQTLTATGVTIFNVSTLSFGSHVIAARYEGSTNFTSSNSSLTEAVTVIGTTLALTSSPNPSNTSQTVTLTATAASAVAGVMPFGVVTFLDGVSVLGTATLNSSGIAQLTTSTLSVGSHPIQAMLPASPTFAGSTSSIVNQIVQSYDFAITSSTNSLTLPSGDWSVLKVTVTPVGGFHGSVTLGCDGSPDHTQCIFRGGNVISLADGAKTVDLTLNTSDVLGYGHQVSELKPSSGALERSANLAAVFLPSLFGLIGLAGGVGRNSRSVRRVLIALCFFSSILMLQACSGKLPGETAPGAYALQIRAASTDGTGLQHSAPLQLIVTPR